MPSTTSFCCRLLLILAYSAQLFPLYESAHCLFPQGNLDTLGTPCNPNAQYSSCCNPEDICLSNGLCFNTSQGIIYRLSCTDPSWGLSCAQYCLDCERSLPCGRLVIDRFGFIIDGAKLRQVVSEIYKLVSVPALHIVAELSTAVRTLTQSLQSRLLKEHISTCEPPSPQRSVPL